METSKKKSETAKRNADREKVSKNKLIKKIQEEAKDMLIPNLKDKMIETTNTIVDILNKKGAEKVNNIQIMSVIAQRSNIEIALGGNKIMYTPQELSIAFNYYLDMINKINEIKQFPPTIESFCCFVGITRHTYNNWLVDLNMKDTMEYIHSYLLGTLATSSLTGEVKEISSIYIQKTMGKVEQTQPIEIKHEITTDISDIQSQLKALKHNNVIDADFREL